MDEIIIFLRFGTLFCKEAVIVFALAMWGRAQVIETYRQQLAATEKNHQMSIYDTPDLWQESEI